MNLSQGFQNLNNSIVSTQVFDEVWSGKKASVFNPSTIICFFWMGWMAVLSLNETQDNAWWWYLALVLQIGLLNITCMKLVVWTTQK